MKLQHFYSDWNGQESKQAYHKKPTIKELTLAIATEHSKGAKVFKRKHANIIIGDTIVEVKSLFDYGHTQNLYRDMYRIL